MNHWIFWNKFGIKVLLAYCKKIDGEGLDIKSFWNELEVCIYDYN